MGTSQGSNPGIEVGCGHSKWSPKLMPNDLPALHLMLSYFGVLFNKTNKQTKTPSLKHKITVTKDVHTFSDHLSIYLLSGPMSHFTSPPARTIPDEGRLLRGDAASYTWGWERMKLSSLCSA